MVDFNLLNKPDSIQLTTLLRVLIVCLLSQVFAVARLPQTALSVHAQYWVGIAAPFLFCSGFPKCTFILSALLPAMFVSLSIAAAGTTGILWCAHAYGTLASVGAVAVFALLMTGQFKGIHVHRTIGGAPAILVGMRQRGSRL
jgi:hypothetical protein